MGPVPYIYIKVAVVAVAWSTEFGYLEPEQEEPATEKVGGLVPVPAAVSFSIAHEHWIKQVYGPVNDTKFAQRSAESLQKTKHTITFTVLEALNAGNLVFCNVELKRPRGEDNQTLMKFQDGAEITVEFTAPGLDKPQKMRATTNRRTFEPLVGHLSATLEGTSAKYLRDSNLNGTSDSRRWFEAFGSVGLHLAPSKRQI